MRGLVTLVIGEHLFLFVDVLSFVSALFDEDSLFDYILTFLYVQWE